jgi:photosystem II stability/assembly factor-like uncharacterized protein
MAIGFITVCSLWNDIYKSIDQGENWTLNKHTSPLKGVYFFDRNKGVACSGGSAAAAHPPGMDIGSVFLTNDGGKTLQYVFYSDWLNSCLFLNDLVGFIAGNEAIYKTNDSGNNWTIVYENNYDSTGYLFSGNDLCFINMEIGWAVGEFRLSDSHGAAIIGTNDGGNNWDIVWRYPIIDAYSFGFNSIHTIGAKAWAVGESGLIVKYTEQDQWQVQTTLTDLPLNEVYFSDEDHGWIAGGYFDDDNMYLKLFKTNDGGDNWIEIQDFEYQINDMFFADSLRGWAVGNDTSHHDLFQVREGRGVILNTSDGGYNWTIQVEDLPARLNAIHFKDGFGWAVGELGLVLRTDDGINWVDQNTGKTYPNKFNLSQNYPNPFNPKTVISYQLPAISDVDLSMYNLIGQKVATLVSAKQNAGYHQVEWDASAFASGIYYYRIQAGEFQDVKKMILIK